MKMVCILQKWVSYASKCTIIVTRYGRDIRFVVVIRRVVSGDVEWPEGSASPFSEGATSAAQSIAAVISETCWRLYLRSWPLRPELPSAPYHLRHFWVRCSMKASVCLFAKWDSLVGWVVEECKAENILA